MNTEPSILAITRIKTHISGIHASISQFPQADQPAIRASTDGLWLELKRIEDALVTAVRARRHVA